MQDDIFERDLPRRPANHEALSPVAAAVAARSTSSKRSAAYTVQPAAAAEAAAARQLAPTITSGGPGCAGTLPGCGAASAPAVDG